MELTPKKFKEESSKFYKIGYRTGYQTACRALEKMEAKDIPKEDERFKIFISECIEELLKNYNSYPCIEHCQGRIFISFICYPESNECEDCNGSGRISLKELE